MSDTRSISDRLSFINLDSQGSEDIQRVQEVVQRELSNGLDKFYQKVGETPEVAKFFSSQDHMGHAKSAQIGHWGKISTGNFDSEYVDKVQTIGSVHARIGLEPRWYIGGYALLVEHLIKSLVLEYWPQKRSAFGSKQSMKADEFAASIASLIKAVMLDMDLAISVYSDEAEKAKQQAQEEAIAEEQGLVNDVFGQAMSRIADKNLSESINQDVPPAYQELKDNFNDAIAKLGDALTQVDETAGEINNSSGTINSASLDLAQRTEQQAASVEETAAAVEEITATVKTTAQRAQDAGELVSSTKNEAENSREIVEKAVNAMAEIKSSSDQVASIISVIDDIAFQTNLLALNAGVEAARAGEAGKGFAVVAQEVRELAQRSATAAKEIKDLINKSGSQVDGGVSLVAETGEALESIVASVVEINTHVSAIAEAADEQATGLQEINTAVNTIDQGTQQNAAMVADTTRNSGDLARHAEVMAQLVNSFRLSGKGSAQSYSSGSRAA